MTDIATPALWEHQKQALSFVRASSQANRGAILAMEMGTGKTRVALECAREAWRQKGSADVLVVCPKSVLPVWEQQTEEFLQNGDIPVMIAKRGKGTLAANADAVKESFAAAEAGIRMLAVNYETLARDNPLRSFVSSRKWDLAVADESHRLKNPKSKAATYLAENVAAERRLALSGTPFVNSLLDIWGQARFCSPDIFGGLNYWQFADRYAQRIPYPRKDAFVLRRDRAGNLMWAVPANKQDFNSRMRQVMFRVESADVLDLPDAVEMAVYAELPPAAAAAYREMDDKSMLETEDGEVRTSVSEEVVLRLQQIAAGMVPVTNKETGETVMSDVGGKRETLKETLECLPENEPVVVFGRFHSDLDAIAAIAGQDRCAELSGRRNQLVEWQNGTKQILAVQADTGSEGIDLTRAKYAIWYTLSWSAQSFAQAKARLLRPGQTRTVRFVYIIAKGTIDELIYGRVRNKNEAAGRTLEASASTL